MKPIVRDAVVHLRRGQPFRVIVQFRDVTEFLSELSSRFDRLPQVAVRPAHTPNVHIDFAGADDTWELSPAPQAAGRSASA